MVSSVEPLQPQVAEHRGLRYWRDCRAILKSKNRGGLAPNERQRGKIMRRVACDSIIRDGSQGGLTGRRGTHDQLLSSSTLSFSPLSEAFSYPTPTCQEPNLPSPLPYQGLLPGCSIRKNLKVMLYTYKLALLPFRDNSFNWKKLHCSDFRHQWMVGKLHCWRNLSNLSEYNPLLLLPSS